MEYTINDLNAKIPDLIRNLNAYFMKTGIKTMYWCSGSSKLYSGETIEGENSIFYVCLDIDIYFDRNGNIIKPIKSKETNTWINMSKFDELVYIYRETHKISGIKNVGGRIIFLLCSNGRSKHILAKYDALTDVKLINSIKKIVDETYEHPSLRIKDRVKKIEEELYKKTGEIYRFNEDF